MASTPNSCGNTYDIAVRAQVLAYTQCNKTNKEITAALGVSRAQIQRYRAEAARRGYDPTVSLVLKDEYLVDKPRSGRPCKVTEERTCRFIWRRDEAPNL